MMIVNDQDRQGEGMMDRGRGAALAEWSGGVVGARSITCPPDRVPAPLCCQGLGRKSGLALRPPPPRCPSQPAPRPYHTRHCRSWSLHFMIARLRPG